MLTEVSFLFLFFEFIISNWRSVTDSQHFSGSKKCRLWSEVAVEALGQWVALPALPWSPTAADKCPQDTDTSGRCCSCSQKGVFYPLVQSWFNALFFQGILDQGELKMLLRVFAEQAPAPPQSGPAQGHWNPLVLILLPWLLHLKSYLLSTPQQYWGRGETDLIN